MEKISIIIPVYNVEKYLQHCLDSVYNQTYKNLEIICVYTKSNDNSYKILNSQNDKRLKIIQKDDGGLGGARNIGLTNVTGDYVFFLDSDDWIEKDAIELLYKKITAEKSDMVFFPFYSYDSVTQKIIKNGWGSTLSLDGVKSPFSYRDLNNRIISEKSIVVAWNKLYSYSFLRKNHITFPENLRYEDNPFYYKCLLKAKKISYLNKKLLYYRINRKNSLQSATYDNKNVLDIVPIMNDVYNTFRNSTLNITIQKAAEEYILNEFAWRYELMNCNVYMFKKNIRLLFGDDFYKMFLRKIYVKIDYKELIKKHKKSNNPKISIIIPVYKVEKFIEDCIVSITNQTLKEIEIIFIDDNSPDESTRIIEEYSKIDERISLYKTTINSGAGIARNIGLEKALGKYIMFIDPDDMLANDNVLKKLYIAAEKNNQNTICANIKVVEKNSHYGNYGPIKKYEGYNVTEEKLIDYSEYNIWSSWGFTRFLYSKKIIDENNIRFPNVRNYEDPVFLVKYLTISKKIYQIEEDIYYYRYIEKNNNVNIETINNTLKSMYILFQCFENNNYYLHYTNEYRNLINFIKYDYNKLLNQKNAESRKAKQLINNLLDQINYNIINDYYDGEVIKHIDLNKRVKRKDRKTTIKTTIKQIAKKFILFFIKPFYSRLMIRIDNRIDAKVQEAIFNNNAIDKHMDKNELQEKIINLEKKIEINKFNLEHEFENLKKENSTLKKYIKNYHEYYKNKSTYSGNKIKVGFLFQIPSFWPSIELVYINMKQLKRDFDVMFFLVDNGKEKSQTNGAQKFIEENDIKYQRATIKNIDLYKPDILIIQSPYDIWHRTEELYSENLLRKGYRIVYIPYGFEISDELRSIELQYRLDFYNNCWKIYTCSEETKNQYIKYNSLLTDNVFAIGSPRLDSIYYKKYIPIKEKIIRNKKKNILIKIHFPLTMNYNDNKMVTPSTELYIDFLCNKYRRDEYNLYLMLHPKFFDEMDEELKQKFLDSVAESKAILIKDEDYREILYNVEAIISDRSGMMIEFAALDIPILYLINKENEEIISEAFKYLFNSFEKGSTTTEIYKFIDSVLDNKDSNRIQRKKAFNSCLPLYDGKAANRILEDIKKTLLEESKTQNNYSKRKEKSDD